MDVEAYARRAAGAIEARAPHLHEVDWPALRADVLAAVAPLLGGDVQVGAFVDRDGHRTPWQLTRGRVRSGRGLSTRRVRARGSAPAVQRRRWADAPERRNRVDRLPRAAHDGTVSTRELVYFVAVSLDGFIASPDGGYGDFTAEPELLHEFTDAFPSHVQRSAGVRADRSRFDTVVMGWNTYTPALDAGIDSPYAHLRQYVVASPGRRVGADVHLVHDAVATVRALKAEPSGTGIYLAGGGRLAGSLLDEIDRLVLKVSPLVLGDGVPLFGRAGYSPRALRVLDQRRFASGLTLVEAVPRR